MKNPVPSTAAIAIGKFRLSDTSLIVAWMTQDCGKVRTTARGALQPKSAFAGKIDLFHETRMTFQLSSRGDLHALKEVEVLEPFPAGSLPYAATLCAGYFSRWVEWVTEPLEPVPALYSLFQRAIAYLREGKLNGKGVEHFERELARLLGIHDPNGLERNFEALVHYAGRKPSGREALLREIAKSSAA